MGEIFGSPYGAMVAIAMFDDQLCFNGLQIRDKAGNAAYMVRQLYQKHLVPYEEYRAQRPNAPARSEAQEQQKMTAFEKMVAAANGKEDIDVLGAVAALMDAPGQDVQADKRLKAGVTQVMHNLRSTTVLDTRIGHHARERDTRNLV